MGRLMLGLAMAAVVLRSYLGLSPWKLALLLLTSAALSQRAGGRQDFAERGGQ